MTDEPYESSQRIAEEADDSRAQLSSTLEDLKERLTPGKIFDEMFEGSGANVSKFIRNFGETVRENPVPAVLLGAGLVMMMTGTGGRAMFASSRSSNRADHMGRYMSSYGDSEAEGQSGSSAGAWDQAKEAASTVTETVRSAANAASDKLSGAGDAVSRLAHSADGAVTEARQSISASGRSMARRAGGLGEFVADQPLLAAALGVAVGAIFAAALPSTDAEDQLMGRSSKSLKEAAKDVAEEQVASVKEAVRDVASEVRSEASAQGLDIDAARSSVDQLGEKLNAVTEKATTTIKQQIRETLSPQLDVTPDGQVSSRKGGRSTRT